MQGIVNQIRSPYTLLLSAIVILNTYFRIWGVHHLFFWMNDYDEGAYSMGARLVSQGYLPYEDFTLVHPPFYDLVLATIYKVFGYNFFYGRYFSVLLSIACIILVYLIVKRFYNRTAGLIACLLFTFFPGFYLLWYRVVQEPLGIFLLLLALYFAIDYILLREKRRRLIFSGFCLGLAVATKYTFVPAVLGFCIGILVISTDWNWREFRSYFSGLIKRDIWILTAGVISGFILITGFFIINTPKEFASQTMFNQLGYRVGNSANLIIDKFMALPEGINNILHNHRGTFPDTIAIICLLVGIASLIFLLTKRKRSRVDIYFIVTLLVTFPLCTSFNKFGEMRYFVSFYPYLLLAMVTFIPIMSRDLIREKITFHSIRTNAGFIGIVLILLIFLGGTVVLRIDYNFSGSANITYEEQAYKDTIDYLEEVKAEKIYSISPIIPALAPNLDSTLEFDTFGYITVMKQAPESFYQDILKEGVDYAVSDQFVLLGFNPSQGKSLRELQEQIEINGILVENVVPYDLPLLGTRIYEIKTP